MIKPTITQAFALLREIHDSDALAEATQVLRDNIGHGDPERTDRKEALERADRIEELEREVSNMVANGNLGQEAPSMNSLERRAAKAAMKHFMRDDGDGGPWNFETGMQLLQALTSTTQDRAERLRSLLDRKT